MGVKTFSVGETLTASDTNTYLANSGLVTIAPTSVTGGTLSGAKVTVDSAVSSVTLTGIFTDSFDNYRIVVHGGAFSGPYPMKVKVGPSSPATGYYAGLIYCPYGGAISSAQAANADAWNWMGFGTANGVGCVIDIIAPKVAKNTFCMTGSYNHSGGSGTCQGMLNNTNSYTDLILLPEAGTWTGGIIMVYGYRLG